MVVELKKERKGAIDHHPPIDRTDLLKLYNYFYENRGSPVVLQSRVFVDGMLHFSRRGRENLRQLKKADFSLRTDPNGLKYLCIERDELTKNHQTNNNTADGRMFEIKGTVTTMSYQVHVHCLDDRNISVLPMQKNFFRMFQTAKSMFLQFYIHQIRPQDLISHPKHMLLVLKRTVSMRRFL